MKDININANVIISIKDDEDINIKSCIRSLKNQDYFHPYEIIVISGGNRAQARNLGIKIAQGDIVA